MAEYAQDPVERVELCRELLHLQGKLKGEPADRRSKAEVLAGRSIRSIRSVLLGRSVSMADDMLAPGVATKALLAHLQAAKDAPVHERTALALYAKAIQASLGTLSNKARSAGVESRRATVAMSGDAELARLIGEFMGPPDAVIDACIGRGALGEGLRDELSGLAGNMERVKAEQAQVLAEYDPKVEVVYGEYKRMVEAARRMPLSPERGAAFDRAQEFFDANVEVLQKERRERFQAAHEAGKVRAAEVGRKIVGQVLTASKVTEEEAVQWAKAQVITPTAKARLRKIGYPADKVVADMAEFYRVIGGRLKRVRIDSRGDRRANATDIEAHGKVGTINLDTNFSRRTLWHELGHHMEADPVAKAAAGRFIRRRSVDGKTYSLRSMTGIKGYHSREVAVNGNFFDAYVGKVYSDGITEVFSMGIETLSDPALLADRALKDPQTMEFVMGFLMGEKNPLEGAHTELRDMIAAMEEEHEENQADQAAQAIKTAADKIALEAGDSEDWIGGWEFLRQKLQAFTQVGRLVAPSGGSAYLLSGKVKNARGRMVKGFMLVINATSFNFEYVPDADINVAKAMYFAWDKVGYMPSYRYFMDRPEGYL